MKRPHLTFSQALPLLGLASWGLLLAAPATLLFLTLLRAAHGGPVAHLYAGQFETKVERSRFVPFALEMTGKQTADSIVAINSPGFVLEILVSLMTTWPDNWHPTGWTVDAARALTYPFFCMPAWWLAGGGIDAFLDWRRLHWIPCLLGTIFLVFSILMFFILLFSHTSSDRAVASYSIWGFGIWTILFASIPIVWYKQRRSQKSILSVE